MSDSPTASPVVLGRWEKPGNLAAIAALAAAGQVTILPHELIRTTDGRVYHWTGTALEITSAPVHHGTVADVAALDGVYLLPSCTRGVHPGDTAYVEAAGCEYRVASGVNATATWAACADPAGTASDAVSAHNTAPDSHADLRTAIARNADHAALSNVLPSAASQNHLTDDELEFFGTLPSTISALMSNVEEVDADFVSISYNPSGGGGGTDAGIWADPCVQWWYDSDTGVRGLAGAPTTTGDAVYAWADRSAHGWSAVQDGKPPSWLASAINGRGAVRFASGSSQRLRARVRTYQAGLVGDFTVFALARRSSISGLALVFGQSASPRMSLYSNTDGSGEDLRIVVGPSSTATATDFTPTTAWELLEVRYRGGTTSFFVNGELIQSVSAVLTHEVTSSEWSLYLGAYYGSQDCDVDLAACICLDGSASDLFCSTVRAWLLAFSGLKD